MLRPGVLLLLLTACGSGSGTGPGPTPDGGGPGGDDACVPPTDQQLCAGRIVECGNIAIQDGCNPERIINCGSCTAPEMCTFGGSCCADTGDLCARYDYQCGTHTITDYCFMQQTVDCGGCNPGMSCEDTGYCGTCLGGFARSGFVPVSTIGEQDIFLGAASDGSSILFLMPSDRATCDTALQLYIADGSLAAYTSVVDISAMGSLAGVTKDATSLFLAGDGLTIVAVTSDGATLGETQRASAAVTAFGPFDTTAYAAINAFLAATPGATLSRPVVSADRLFLYYSISGSGAATDGIYEAQRATAAVPFAPGVRLGADVQAHLGVSGVSPDGLRLYLITDLTVGLTTIFTRQSTDQPFSNPWAPDPAPTAAGYRLVPLDPCILIGNWQVDGCRGEEVVLFEAPL